MDAGTGETGWRARCALAAAVLVALAFPGLAEAQSVLDPSFGVRGRVVEKVHVMESPQAVQLSSGRIVILGDRQLLGFEADGKTAADFNGVVDAIGSPPQFSLLGLVLVAAGEGVTVFVEGHRPLPSPPESAPQVAQLARYSSAGALDQSFANGGVLVTDFGLLAPVGRSTGATVSISGVAVDSTGRTLVTGARVINANPSMRCRDLIAFSEEIFVARLTPNGTLDPTFGEGGIVRLDGTAVSGVPPASFIGRPVLDSEGGVYVVTEHPRCLAGPTFITHLRSDGSADQAFGSGGSRKLPAEIGGRPELFGGRPELIRAPNGRLLLRGDSGRFLMLRSTGSVDRSFGRKGQLTPFSHRRDIGISTAAFGSSGRIWLAGDRELPGEHFVPFVASLTASGRLDKRFGDRGTTFTGFGRGGVDAGYDNLLIGPHGRPIAIGETFTKGGRTIAFVMARYLTPR